MKKRIASLALATAIFMGSLPVYGAVALKDIADSRYRKAIENIYDKGIMEGDSAGTFRPSDSISRAEFATVIAKWKKLSVTGKSSFKDVKGHWAEGYIAAVQKKGWISGVDEGSFDPDGKITYRDALKTIVSILGKDSEAVQFGGYPSGYTYVAEKYKLTEKMTGSYEAPVFRGAVAQAIDNAISLEGGSTSAPSFSKVESQEVLEDLNVKVKKDTDLSAAVEKLPREALVKLKGGTSVFLKIEWNLNSYYNKDSEGTYSISGKIQLPTGITDPDKKISTVYGYIEVVDEEAEFNKKVVNTVGRVQPQTTVSYGTSEASAKKALPKEVKLYMVGGGEAMAGISWNIDKYDGETPGKYKAKGRVVLPSGVVDTLNVLEDIEAELVVDKEETTLVVESVEPIDLNTYKIKTNRVIKNILDDTVKIELLDETVNPAVAVEEYPHIKPIEHGDGQNEFIVKLDGQLKLGSKYRFTVKDPMLPVAAGEATKDYTAKATDERFEISSVVLEDNIVPAGEPMGQVEFKALNKDGEDITGTVRHTVTVKKSWNTTDTTADKEIEVTGNISDGEVRYFYLNYKDAEGKDRRTDEKRIIFQDRKAKSFEDWSLEKQLVNLDFENEKHYAEESTDELSLYINALDQFGDLGLAKIEKQNIEITVTRGKEYIDGSSLSGDKLRLNAAGEFKDSPVANIKLKDLAVGKVIELKVKINGVERSIVMNIEKDAELSGFKFSDEIEKNKNKIVMSSSEGLTWPWPADFAPADRSKSVPLYFIDQRNNEIELGDRGTRCDIAEKYKPGYDLRNEKIYKANPDLNLGSEEPEFSDISNSRYKEAIEYMYRRGIIVGNENGEFKPINNITRAEFATIIFKTMNLESIGTISFSDVSNNSWYEPYIKGVVQEKYMSGTSSNKFSPGENIKYQDVLKVMVSIMDKADEAEAFGGYPNGYISVARKYGITSGIAFDYNKEATREVIAQVIKNAMEKKYMANEKVAKIMWWGSEIMSIDVEKEKDAEFELEFWIEGDEEGEKIGSKNLSVTIVNPGLPKTIFVEGFKKEILDTENMELNFFELDSEGIKVKRVDEDVNVKIEDMSKGLEEREIMNITRKGIYPRELGEYLEANKVYRLTVTVEDIEILRDYIAVTKEE